MEPNLKNNLQYSDWGDAVWASEKAWQFKKKHTYWLHRVVLIFS